MKYLSTHNTKAKLDLTDKKILYYLSKNARESRNKIAKKVRVSKDTVKYRISNLIKKEVIRGFKTIVDIKKFGYDSYHLFLRLNTMNPKIEERVIKELKSYNFVRAILKFNGSYDYELAIIAKDIQDYDEKLKIILNNFSDTLKNQETLIITNILEVTTGLPRSFIKISEDNKIAKLKTEKYKTDEKDFTILKHLSDNAIIPYHTISKETGLNIDTIRYRVTKMINAGIILSFVPAMNYAAMGLNLQVLLVSLPTLNSTKERTLIEFLKKNQHIVWAAKTIGKYDMILYLCTKDFEEVHNSLNELRNIFGTEIQDYDLLIANEEFKYIYFPEEMELNSK